jgi:hypothetical protein
MTCSEQNRVAFTVGEITRDGFQCLKDNQNKCREGAPESECILMDDLSRGSQLRSHFTTRLDSTVSDQSCKRASIASSQVSIQRRYFDPAQAQTEGGVCVQCATAQNEQFTRLEAQVKELKETVDRQQEMLARKPEGPPPGGKDRMASGRRPPKDDMDMDDEDMPRPPRGSSGGGGPSGMGNMNMGSMGGMNGMNMGSMGGMSSMMGMNSMYGGYSPYTSMMNYGGMNTMGGMSSMYRSPFMNSGYGSTGYLNSGLGNYYRSPFTQTSTPYAGAYPNFSLGGATSLYSPYTYTGYGR